LDLVFSPYSSAEPFALFGWWHLATLGALVLFGLWVVRSGLSAGPEGRRLRRWLLVTLLVVVELEWHGWQALHGFWSVRRMLPFHMCSVLTYATMVALAGERRRLYPLLYYFGIAGALQAVLTPDSGFGFPHIRFLNTMVGHGVLVISGVWVVVVEGYRPTWRHAWRCLGALHLYAAFVFVVNRLLGSNYLWIMAKPPSASALDAFPDWPWYLIPLDILVVGVLILMTWPFARRGPA